MSLIRKIELKLIEKSNRFPIASHRIQLNEMLQSKAMDAMNWIQSNPIQSDQRIQSINGESRDGLLWSTINYQHAMQLFPNDPMACHHINNNQNKRQNQQNQQNSTNRQRLNHIRLPWQTSKDLKNPLTFLRISKNPKESQKSLKNIQESSKIALKNTSKSRRIP